MKTSQALMEAYFKHYRDFNPRIWSLALVSLLNSMGYVSIVFLPLFLHTTLHLPATKVALFVSLYSLAYTVGSYLGGKLNDHIDSMMVISLSLIIRAVSSCCLYFITEHSFVIAMVMIIGFADGGFRPAMNINFMQFSSKDDRVRVNSLYRMAINLGLALAGVLGIVIEYLNYSSIFLMGALFNLIALGALVMKIGLNVSATSQDKQTEVPSAISKTRLWKDKTFIILCLVIIINNISYGQLNALFPIYLQQQFQISSSVFGYLLLLNTSMIIVLQVPLHSFLARFDQIYIAMIGCFLLSSGMSLVLLGESIFWVILSVVTWSLGEIIAFTTLFGIVFSRTDLSNRGTYVGVYYMVIAITSIIAPLLGGWLYQFNNGHFIWLFCLPLGLVNSLLLYTIRIKFKTSST